MHNAILYDLNAQRGFDEIHEITIRTCWKSIWIFIFLFLVNVLIIVFSYVTAIAKEEKEEEEKEREWNTNRRKDGKRREVKQTVRCHSTSYAAACKSFFLFIMFRHHKCATLIRSHSHFSGWCNCVLFFRHLSAT